MNPQQENWSHKKNKESKTVTTILNWKLGFIMENITGSNVTYLSTQSDICKNFQVTVDLLHKYYTVFLIIFGFIGNSLTIIVFWRTKFAHSLRTSFYLICLAISDITFLVCLSYNYLNIYYGIFPVTYASFRCKLVNFLSKHYKKWNSIKYYNLIKNFFGF